MVYITRRERFCAAHKLYRNEWSPEKNEEVFGPCSNPNWHGHNYEVCATIKGEPNPETGFVANLKDLRDVMREIIVNRTDHKNLNLDVDFMQGILPSTENLAIAIWNELERPVRKLGAHLHCVKIVETENNVIEYYG